MSPTMGNRDLLERCEVVSGWGPERSVPFAGYIYHNPIEVV